MATDSAAFTIRTTAPNGVPARLLRDLGFMVNPIEDEEGHIDRYILAPQLAVERRTPRTFLEGIRDKSLFTSAIYLHEHFDTAVLIMEGHIDFDATGFHPQAVRGALSAMVLEYGLSVLPTADAEETAHLLAMMAQHVQVGVPEISLTPKRKAVELPDLQRRVVEMLPGCGHVAARALLQTFGSIARIVEADTAALSSVRGIGKKRAAEIHSVLQAEYRAVDTERDLEDAVEAAPLLIFDHDVTLLARQHVIITADERHVVDLVFLDSAPSDCGSPDFATSNDGPATLILVELKRSLLKSEHEAQLRRYIEVAPQSPMLRAYLDVGARMRGVLATVSRCDYMPTSDEVTVLVVDEAAVIEVLLMLRRQRLAVAEAEEAQNDTR